MVKEISKKNTPFGRTLSRDKCEQMALFSSSTATLVSVIVTLVVAVVTARFLDLSLALEALRSANLLWLLGAVTFFAFNYLLRAQRFRLLLDLDGKPLRAVLGVTMLHGLFNYLLPAKSGELSYLVLARKQLGTRLAQSAATLITARFFDLGIVALFVPIAVWQFDDELPRWLILSSIIYSGVVLCSASLLVLYLRRSSAPEHRHRQGDGWWSRMMGGVHKTIDGIRIIDSREQYVKLWAVSLGIWLCVLMNYYCMTASLGFAPTLGQMVVMCLVMIPLTMLPLQGFANVGTHEAGWATALVLFGFSLEDALTLAVTSHVLLFAMFAALGLIGYAVSSRNT
jgi:uncharacterized protein (TIRG00374 family)